MRRLWVMIAMLLLASAGAQADGISLEFQHVQIIKLAKPAKTVVIGDPYVADLTLENPQTIVLFGKQPGITNMVVFDQDSNILFDWPVMVNDAIENRVSVISPGEKRVAEAVWMCGDNGRCIRIPGNSEIDPFKYNATAAKDDTTSTGNKTNNADGGNGSNTGNGGTGDTTQPPPSN
jgi:hypothetical protein